MADDRLMKRWIGVVLLGLAVLLCGGCTEVVDAFNAGEKERESNEANRRRFHQARAEAVERKFAPILQKAKKPSKEPVVQLDPESPEGMLLAELTARLACRDDVCRSEGLQRLRRHSATLLPSLPKLMTGQSDPIVVESLRLAGLFKVRGAVDAVARVLLLGGKRLQEEAIWSLGAIGDARGVDSLRRFGSLDHPPRMMAASCRALGQIGTAAALQPIQAIFMQGTPETRVECLEAAARVGTSETRAFFELAIKDPRPAVSQLAAEHLTALESSPPVAEPPAGLR